MGFKQQLAIGRIGESLIAKWLISKNYNVLPVYEKEISDNKGPTLFSSDSKQLICMDLFVFNKRGKAFWIEAKHKTAFSWHRNTDKWVTGIDLHHYKHYLKIADYCSPWPIYLMFLHKNGVAKDTPKDKISPSGLFGGELQFLRKNENHRHRNHGRSGMVYWGIDVLKKYCELDEMFNPKEYLFDLKKLYNLCSNDISLLTNNIYALSKSQIINLGKMYVDCLKREGI